MIHSFGSLAFSFFFADAVAMKLISIRSNTVSCGTVPSRSTVIQCCLFICHAGRIPSCWIRISRKIMSSIFRFITSTYSSPCCPSLSLRTSVTRANHFLLSACRKTALLSYFAQGYSGETLYLFFI